jgi:hypothetical protein
VGSSCCQGAVEGDCGFDQPEVGERLGEVDEQLAAGADLL